ncbi:MAG TPA: type VI secretion system baseplate subunit TssE, partial [Polyangiaceae bacterium]|nr:type VI secretion system baseplate subunit TssE [Polyangiaceae bacterium]
TVQDLDAYPYVEQSTLNYGMPDLAGKTASTVDSSALEKSIRRAIWEFEPRLLKESVRVKAVVNDKQMNHNALCFTIEAELWAQPLPLRLFLRTDVDLETGSVVVTEAARTD